MAKVKVVELEAVSEGKGLSDWEPGDLGFHRRFCTVELGKLATSL